MGMLHSLTPSLSKRTKNHRSPLGFHPPVVQNLALSVEQWIVADTLTPYTNAQIAARHSSFHPRVLQMMVLSGIIFFVPVKFCWE
jgi:hypothetical protein